MNAMSNEADIVERLVQDHQQLSKMSEAARFAGRETGVRVRDTSALLHDLDDAVAEIAKLRAERDDLKADYLRRHNDACDYWLVLKRIADGYGPDHLSKACRDWAQFAIDEAHRRTDTPGDQQP